MPPEQEPLPFESEIEAPPRLARPEDEDEDEDAEGTDPDDEAPTEGKRKRKKKRRRGKPKRRNLDDDTTLPRQTVHCHAPDDQCCPTCGNALSVIGKARSLRVEWVPGHFIIQEFLRDKCACSKHPGEGVLTVPGPTALDRAMCGNGLLARVLVDKFADHLPLNRQAGRMGREGFEVGSNTLSGWVLQASPLAHVLALAVRQQVCEAPALQGDDTGHPVQDGGNGHLRKGRLWVFTDQEQAFYAFTPTKEGVYPAELLKDYAGTMLLVDGGSEFNQAVREHDLERSGCWSHLRTYFWKALPHHPHEADLALGTINDLFMLEREHWGTMVAEEIRARRQEHSKPLVDGFYRWVNGISTTVRPKSPLGAAIRYARNQEGSLRVFLDRGELPMHNNLSELLLRQPVVGRKNWLFSRSEGGAKAAADYFTLIGSCMLQGIDPHAYLVDVLPRVMDHPAHRIHEFTPKSWRLAHKKQGTSEAPRPS
ncbi:MAG: IS66 family transposase [Myxococcota bacterium]